MGQWWMEPEAGGNWGPQLVIVVEQVAEPQEPRGDQTPQLQPVGPQGCALQETGSGIQHRPPPRPPSARTWGDAPGLGGTASFPMELGTELPAHRGERGGRPTPGSRAVPWVTSKLLRREGPSGAGHPRAQGNSSLPGWEMCGRPKESSKALVPARGGRPPRACWHGGGHRWSYHQLKGVAGWSRVQGAHHLGLL